jgi:hypothetical protein
MNASQARVEEVFAEAARLFASKNLSYGDSWREQGWRGNVSRILEKAKRLRTMVWRGGNVLLNGSSEHPRETMLDMINTLAFAIINMDDSVEWGNEPNAALVQASGLAYMGTATVDLGTAQLADRAVVLSGEVPTPGEEGVKPTPRKRQPGQGSGPRPVQERPKQ